MKTQCLGSGVVVAILLVAGSLTPTLAQDLVRRHTSLEEATAIAAQLTQRQANPVRVAIATTARARATLDALPTWPGRQGSNALEGAYEQAIERYAESVLELGETPHPDTLAELSAAIRHSDDRVRYAALTALREGAVSSSHSPILSDARALITGDPVPVIRRQAFEVYCRWGDQDDVLSLSMTLGRAPGPVQDLAVREWIRIEKERLSATQSSQEWP